MKRQILSVFLVLCLCFFTPSAAYAWQETFSSQADLHTETYTAGLAARDGTIPTPQEAYEAMTALQNQDAYKEGTAWTNDEPYSDAKGYYHWKGGALGGTNISAVGCVAFAFILSDAAFGSLPARMYPAGGFSYADIKTGDILRVNNDVHTVIVLEVNDAGVVVAEGNVSTGDHKGKVHWGRTISKEEVMAQTSHYITRYPEGYQWNDPDADAIISEGNFEGLNWKLTKAGTLTISGSGTMPDYSSAGEAPWSSYNDKIRKIVIGNGITGIGSCAFWGCGALSVEIPSSVKAIGNNAFYKSSLIYVTVPSSVKTIGNSAFYICPNLSSATVCEGVETIGQNAFYGCTSLTSITLPSSIGEVGAAAFFQCTAMTNAKFTAGSKLVKLGDNIFTGCYYLMSVTLPKKIDRIGDGMFQNCMLLAGVEIPEGAKSIGTFAFASSGVNVVIIPETVTTIGTAAFSACPLTDIYFTGTETQWMDINKIGDTAAAVSKAIMHYNYVPPTTPDPAPGDGSSDDNNSNTPGNGSDSIGGNDQTGGSDQTGGNDQADDGPTDDDPAGGSDQADNSPTGGSDQADGDDDPEDGSGKKPTALAKGSIFTVSQITYKVTKAGKEVQLIRSRSVAKKITVNTVTGTDGVKYKVTSIGAKAMQKNRKMTSLAMGSYVKAIGANAFSGCTDLAKVTFGKNVTSIGTSAFEGCSSLAKTLTLPDSVKTVGTKAFSGCKRITAVVIGKTSKSSLKAIGKNTFNGCNKLGKITIKSTKLSSVGKQAFKGTKSGLKVKVPSRQLTKYKKIFKKAGLKNKQVTK